jgi:hypothetical protein
MAAKQIPGFHRESRENDYISKHRGEYVNLFRGNDDTQSGIIEDFDEARDEIVLKGAITILYRDDGTSYVGPNPELYNIPWRTVNAWCLTSEEDYQGRIKKYNKDKEIGERARKASDLVVSVYYLTHCFF